jgi:hypothetical protein
VASYCYYLELLVAKPVFGDERRVIPWRLVHLSDEMEYPVCRQAAAFIDTIWRMPVLQLSSVAPRVVALYPALQRLRELRYRLVTLKGQMKALASAAAASSYSLSHGQGVRGGGLPSEAPYAEDERELPPAARDLLRLRLGEEYLYMADTPEMLALAHFVDACVGRLASVLTDTVAAAESYTATRSAPHGRNFE